jgi:hypothetical protein
LVIFEKLKIIKSEILFEFKKFLYKMNLKGSSNIFIKSEDNYIKYINLIYFKYGKTNTFSSSLILIIKSSTLIIKFFYSKFINIKT